MNLPDDLAKEDFNWCDTDIIGTALIIKGGSIDSHGNPIRGNIYYHVGKHKNSGMVAIIPTDRDLHKEFENDIINNQLKKDGRFN